MTTVPAAAPAAGAARATANGALVWTGVAAAFALDGAGRLTWIDVLLLFGALVIVPLAAWAAPWPGRRTVEACLASGLLLVPSLAMAPGPLAAALVLPWLAVSAAVAWGVLRPIMRPMRERQEGRLPDPGAIADAAAAVWFVVAAGALPVSRMGWTAFGIEEPIVKLTAVHYTFAGVATSLIAGMAWRRASGGVKTAAAVGVGLVVGGPPIVAVGFFTKDALPQVGGAVLLTVGVYAVAFVLLVSAGSAEADGPTRALLIVGSLSIVVPMVLAVSWAAAQHVRMRSLSVPDMARVHGTMNALGWSLCGLAARARTNRTPDRRVFVDRA